MAVPQFALTKHTDLNENIRMVKYKVALLLVLGLVPSQANAAELWTISGWQMAGDTLRVVADAFGAMSDNKVSKVSGTVGLALEAEEGAKRDNILSLLNSPVSEIQCSATRMTFVYPKAKISVDILPSQKTSFFRGKTSSVMSERVSAEYPGAVFKVVHLDDGDFQGNAGKPRENLINVAKKCQNQDDAERLKVILNQATANQTRSGDDNFKKAKAIVEGDAPIQVAAIAGNGPEIESQILGKASAGFIAPENAADAPSSTGQSADGGTP